MGAALALGACAHQAPRPSPALSIDEQVTRLPAADRQDILNMQQRSNVAQANLTAAMVARDQSLQFRDLAIRESKVADERRGGASHALDFAHRSQNVGTIQTAETDLRAADVERDAARLKVDYSEKLVDLRNAQVDERNAELGVANADLRALKEQKISDAGLAPRSAGQGFAQDSARGYLGHAQQHLGEIRSEAVTAHLAWQQKRREVATLGAPTPVHPPAAPAPLPQPE
jgi:hypothetical protein